MEKSVKGKLSKEAYELLNLPDIRFNFGDVEFFNEETIDGAQAGFRYNGLTGEVADGWTGDDYVIIGYDSSVGCGPDPYIVNVADPKLPVYWLLTDGGDWKNPDLICDSLKQFNEIMNVLNEYAEYLESEELTQEQKDEILNRIREIECKEDISEYWDELLDRGMPFEDED